jgi:hypothetical protein
MVKIIFISFLVVVLAGCASSGRIGALPTIAPGKEVSKLVVYRISSIVGVANSYYVTLDGRDIFSIRSGEFTQLSIEAGEHSVGIKCFGGFSPTWKEDAVQFSALPKSESFFEISPNLSCAEIKAVTVEEGKKQINNSKFISSEQMSN